MIPQGPVEDDRPSSLGLVFAGGLAVVCALLWLVFSQLASDEGAAPLDAGLTGAPATTVPAVSTSLLDEAPATTAPATTLPSTSVPSTTAAPTTVAPESTQPSSTELERTDPATGPVELFGDELVPMPASGLLTDVLQDPAIGTIAPEFEGLDFADNLLSVSADGRPKVVIFVAHWCPHCQKEVPQVVELYEGGLLSTEVDVYAVSTAVDEVRGNYPPDAWLEAERWPFPVIRDSGFYELMQGFGGTGFPFAVYLDGENRVVARSVGSLTVEEMLAAWGLLAE